jgi:hypothetical protein
MYLELLHYFRAPYFRSMSRLAAACGTPREANETSAQSTAFLAGKPVDRLAGGGSPGCSTNESGVATSVHSHGDASAQEHCQGSDGAEAGGSLVLDGTPASVPIKGLVLTGLATGWQLGKLSRKRFWEMNLGLFRSLWTLSNPQPSPQEPPSYMTSA